MNMANRMSEDLPTVTGVEMACVEKLKELIELTCRSLELNSYESFIVIATGDGHFRLGSMKGRRFLETHYGLISEFVQSLRDHNIPGLDGNNYQEPLGTQPAKEYIKSEILNENSKEENDPVKIENDGVQNTVPGQTFSSELSKMNIGFSLASDFYNDDLGQSDASQADRELEIDTESGGGTNLQPGDVRDWVTCIIKQETVEQADYDNVKNTNDSEEPVRSVKVEVETESIEMDKNVSAKKQKGNSKEKKEYPCDICSKIFFSATRLEIHRRLHTGERPYSCEICGRQFRDPSTLDRHLFVHSSSRPFTCNVCGKTFKHRGSYNIHKRLHTTEKPFVCETCGKGFVISRYLVEHRRIHSDEKTFCCDVCPQKYRFSSELSVHKRMHAGIKTHICDVCGKICGNSSFLVTHRRTHTDERPFDCDLCGSKFKRRAHLERHRLVHTGAKPHPCPECESQFPSAYALRRHQLIHTGEKPYTCTICKKNFRHLWTLKQHKTTHPVHEDT